MNSLRKFAAGAALALTLGTGTALADPINGAFSIAGAVAPLGSAQINTATGLDFIGAGTSNNCTGDIATVIGANCGGASSTTLDIAAGTIVGNGAVNILVNLANWITLSLGGVSFDLGSITFISRLGGAVPSITISGTGTMHLAGYDATSGFFSLSTQGTPSQGGSFSFSSTQISTAVPEPATLALLALGLGLIGFTLRRKA